MAMNLSLTDISRFDTNGLSDAGTRVNSRRGSIAASQIIKEMQIPVDSGQSWIAVPLCLYCVITGMVSAIAFCATSIWVSFQSGNTVQIGLMIAETFAGIPKQGDFSIRSFHMNDRFALVSLGSFAIGAQFCRTYKLFGLKDGSKASLCLNTFVQALMLLVALVIIHVKKFEAFSLTREDPAWTGAWGFVTVAFIALSCGMQGYAADVVKTPFTNTVVLTSLYCQLATQPFRSMWLNEYPIPHRDYKILSILLVILGGLIGRCLIGSIGSAGSLGVVIGFKILAGASWMLVKPEELELPSPRNDVEKQAQK